MMGNKAALLAAGLASAMLAGCQAVHMVGPSADNSAQMNRAPVISRVDLYPDSLGYIGYRGTVDGDATISLTVGANAINDLLKTIVFEDASNLPPEVTFATPIPLSVKLHGLPLAPDQGGSWTQLLEQLKGHRIMLHLAGGRNISGRLIAVQTAWPIYPVRGPTPEILNKSGGPAIFSFMNKYVDIYTHGKISRVMLSKVVSFKVCNRTLRKSMAQALAFIAANRTVGSSRIELRFRGTGPRTVRFGYVAQSPLWRTTYRMLLPPSSASATAGGNSARLLAMAIVHNPTSTPWKQITLHLRGTWPHSFIEDLQQPLYGRRPILPLPANTALTPQNDLFYLSPTAIASTFAAKHAVLSAMPTMALARDALAMPMASMARAYNPMMAPSINVTAMAVSSSANPAFDLVARDVTIGSQQSATFPVLSAPIAARAVSSLDFRRMTRHLRRSLLVFNDTGHYLPGGPITVYQAAAYAGEVNAGAIAVHARQLLPYATDLALTQTAVTPFFETVKGARITNSQLFVDYRVKKILRLTLHSLHVHRIEVVVNFGSSAGWKIIPPKKGRLIKLQTGAAVVLQVPPMSDGVYHITRIGHQTNAIDLRTISLRALTNEIATVGLPASVVVKLRRLQQLEQRVVQNAGVLQRLKAELATLTQNERRIRANLVAAKQVRRVAQVFAKQLVALDNKITDRQKAFAKAKLQRQADQKAVTDYIQSLQ